MSAYLVNGTASCVHRQVCDGPPRRRSSRTRRCLWQQARLGGGASTGEPDRDHGQGHRVLPQVGGVEGPAR